MKKNGKSFFGHILRRETSDIGEGVKIELTDGRELSVRGCRGFIEYGERIIVLALSRGCLRVSGEGLVCDSYANEAVLINGKIISAEFLGGDGNETVL